MALLEREKPVGNKPEHRKSPEFEKSSLVVATDIEGPHLLGDTALNVMSAYVHPEGIFRDGIDFGAILYGSIYEWFEENFDSKGLGQEGSDIILAMPTLLCCGADGKMIKQEAEKSRRTPGSEAYLKYLKEQGAVVIGVSSAWRQPHEEIVLNKLGLDYMFGTDFPIDQAREEMMQSGHWDEEMHLTKTFLTEIFCLIYEMSQANPQKKEALEKTLKGKIGNFYVDKLGVSWDATGKQRNGANPSLIAQIMAKCDVVGDKRKAEVTDELFFGNGKSVKLAIGDGFNDRRMLAQSPWSIGVNGAEAAKAAKIGVITSDMSVLSLITEKIRIYRSPTRENVDRVIAEAQEILRDKAIIHEGGNVPESLLARHKKMKKEIRGKGAMLP